MQNEYTNRRMSDPSSSWNYFQHASLKRTGVRKSRSELENVDSACTPGCNEVEAGNIEDGKEEILQEYWCCLCVVTTVSVCSILHLRYACTSYICRISVSGSSFKVLGSESGLQ